MAINPKGHLVKTNPKRTQSKPIQSQSKPKQTQYKAKQSQLNPISEAKKCCSAECCSGQASQISRISLVAGRSTDEAGEGTSENQNVKCKATNQK